MSWSEIWISFTSFWYYSRNCELRYSQKRSFNKFVKKIYYWKLWNCDTRKHIISTNLLKYTILFEIAKQRYTQNAISINLLKYNIIVENAKLRYAQKRNLFKYMIIIWITIHRQNNIIMSWSKYTNVCYFYVCLL